MLHPEVTKKAPEITKYIQELCIPIQEISKNFLLAFVHKSFAADYKKKYEHNERLEFLGDGILWAVINKFLYIDHPDLPESRLTLYKIAFVREEMLAEVARDIDLGKHLFISNGEEKMWGRTKDSLLSDALEAIIGAIFLDLGIEQVEQFIKRHLYIKFEKINTDPVKSYKTMIQELVQKRHKALPEYRDTPEETSATWNVTKYKSEIFVIEDKQSEGFWPSKKKAQEAAAKSYYQKLLSSQ